MSIQVSQTLFLNQQRLLSLQHYKIQQNNNVLYLSMIKANEPVFNIQLEWITPSLCGLRDNRGTEIE
jgi:hypothetical protein